MAETYGALAQSTPSALTLTDIYTLPVGRRASGQVRICNLGPSTTVRLQHAVDGAASSNPQYLLFDYILPAATTVSSLDVLLSPGDVLRAYSASGQVTFNFDGVEENA